MIQTGNPVGAEWIESRGTGKTPTGRDDDAMLSLGRPKLASILQR
jgi:hypothetical protein